MGVLIRLVLLLLLLAVLVVGATGFLALSDAPLVTDKATLSHEDIARARAILKRNDPRGLPPGSRRVIEISQQDLNLAANYLWQKAVPGSARLTLRQGEIGIAASARIPHLPLHNHLNIDGAIQARGGQPEIARLVIGSIEIPGALATRAGHWLLGELFGEQQIRSLFEAVQDLEPYPDRLRLTYRWSPALIDQARDTLLTVSDRDALRHYLDRLVELQARGIGTRGSVSELLSPLFAVAQVRSQTHDPVEENVALLTVLGTWASRQNLHRLVPEASELPRPFQLKIARRTDFAQHFLASAALAARGDTALSDAVGLFKEIFDTDQGSGFSFTDIAADRAGTRFGEIATRSADSARQLQQQLAAGVSDDALVPAARDLPEHMDAATFRRRFGEVGSPAYRAMMDEIERRIDALPLYRG